MNATPQNDTDAREQLRIFVASVSRLLDAIERDYKTGKVWKTASCVEAANDVQHLVTVYQSISHQAAASSSSATSSPAT